MELKARTAKYEDASQLAKYKDALEAAGERNILMWLVAPQIPKSVRDFLDGIGIEYTEIHEPEYRNVASRHGYEIKSESEEPPLPVDTSPPQTTYSPRISGRHGSGASDFLDRCQDDRARAFFSAFFERQQVEAGKTRITWDHQSGFSMQFKFQRLGYVEMVWGLPAANRDGKIMTGARKNRLEFPLDFAQRRRVPRAVSRPVHRGFAERNLSCGRADAAGNTCLRSHAGRNGAYSEHDLLLRRKGIVCFLIRT